MNAHQISQFEYLVALVTIKQVIVPGPEACWNAPGSRTGLCLLHFGFLS
ncbi:MAG: hypothetical protein ACM3PS_12735 [Syntrophothermus sp.]